MSEFRVGQAVEGTFTVLDENDALADPGAAAVKYRNPATNAITTKVLADCTRISIGLYRFLFTPPVAGRWLVQVSTTNPDTASPVEVVRVASSPLD